MIAMSLTVLAVSAFVVWALIDEYRRTKFELVKAFMALVYSYKRQKREDKFAVLAVLAIISVPIIGSLVMGG